MTLHTDSDEVQAPQSSIDGESIRSDFPVFERSIHDHRLVYLDSAGSSQAPEAVIRAVAEYSRWHHANVHRGVYMLSEEASDLYEKARTTIAGFIGANDPNEVIFTRGTTEAINLVASSWGEGLGPGDAIVLSEMEHHANIVPWQLLAERRGVELRWAPITDEGVLDLDAFRSLLDESVRLVTLVHVSNVLGTINPIEEIVAAARNVGALVMLDAAQSVPHMPVDVGALDVDFLAFSGHKMLGPTGIGCLWARKELLDSMPPWQGGGGMIETVSRHGSTWAPVPQKFEAGTPSIAQAIGLAEAVRYLGALGMERVEEHDTGLVKTAIDRLSDVPGFRLLGPRSQRAAAVAFALDGVHAHDLATILDRRGIAVRAGHHCTMPLHARLGVPASTRASFHVYNTPEDIDALALALVEARGIFGLN